MSIVTGRTIPSVKVAQASVFDGTNPIAQLRIESHPTTPGGNGTAYTQASFSAVYYTVYREERGSMGIVSGYNGVALTIASQVYDTLQGWELDTRGYNFQHVIPLAALDATARHVVVYRFVLAASPSPAVCIEHRINYRGLGGLSTVGGSSSSSSDTTPIDLIYSQGATVTVSSTVASTIISGSPTITANTWSLQNVLVVRAQGYYSTAATLAGDFTVLLKLGGTTQLTFAIQDIQESQTDEYWELEARFVRYSIGSSGTIIGGGKFGNALEGGGMLWRGNAQTAVATLASDADKAVEVTADWENSGNSFKCSLLEIGWERVVA